MNDCDQNKSCHKTCGIKPDVLQHSCPFGSKQLYGLIYHRRKYTQKDNFAVIELPAVILEACKFHAEYTIFGKMHSLPEDMSTRFGSAALKERKYPAQNILKPLRHLRREASRDHAVSPDKYKCDHYKYYYQSLMILFSLSGHFTFTL